MADTYRNLNGTMTDGFKIGKKGNTLFTNIDGKTPINGDLWIDAANNVVKQYNLSNTEWVELGTVPSYI